MAIDYKKMVSEDINQLKHLQLDILPPELFYPKVARLLFYFYLVIVGFPLVTTILLKGGKLSPAFYFNDWLVLTIIFMAIGLIGLTKFAEYITFKETIIPHLALGNSIQRLFKMSSFCFFIVYTFWTSFYTAFLYTWNFSPIGERLLTVIPGFLFGIISASTLFEMELTRIGAASLFEVIESLRKRVKPKMD